MTSEIDPTRAAGVAHVARLSRLALTPDESKAMGEHMAKILAWVEELNEIETDGVSPSLHDEAIEPSRLDEPRASLSHDDSLANAPRRDGGGFAVPAVIGE